VDELIENLDELVSRIREAQSNKEIVSIAYVGNVVDIWERFAQDEIFIHVGSDQTSLHNPFAGGYYPVGLSFEESNRMMADEPDKFKEVVYASLRRHAAAVDEHTNKGTYFFDYGNAFLLESSRAGADILAQNGIDFKYPSYVQDILGPMCFDYGFGPFRWVCASGLDEDLAVTDAIAAQVMRTIMDDSPPEIRQQMADNIKWIDEANQNQMVVGSKARILYADSEGRIKIAKAFNQAVATGKLKGPIILGRDHHDVSGTDSPYRETSNIYDGSKFTADMAIHNVIGDSFRGATWVSIHNGGGVGWGEVMNGGFGMLLDGSEKASKGLESMLLFDVNNGIARRSWARNTNAQFAIRREMERNKNLKITLAQGVKDDLLDNLFN
jgi:urocanate hydratase